MKSSVDKQVQMADHRAKRLEQLAALRGTTEDALIEEALDLLFRENEENAMLQEDWEQLRQLEGESGPSSSSTALPIQLEETVFVVGTPIPPERIRARSERR